MAPERLDLGNGGVAWKASIKRAHLAVDCGEPHEDLGDCPSGLCVVADDQLSCFLGELPRSRQIDGGRGRNLCRIAFAPARAPN
jgi:hypothetical protein